jgi:omega-amidase
LQICYDLRFPTFARNKEDYDLLIYVANWPKTRINAWDILLKSRAIENMCYTIGVNRIGTDDSNLEYVGHSQVNDYLGNNLVEANENEGIFITTLNKIIMLKTRKKLGFLDDRD